MTSTNITRKNSVTSMKKSKQRSVSVQKMPPSMYQTRLLAYRHNSDNVKARVSFLERIRLKLHPRASFAYKEMNKLKKELAPQGNAGQSFIKERIDNLQTYENLKSSKINKGIESRQKFIYYFKSLQIKFVPLAMVYFTIALSSGNFSLKIPRHLHARLKNADCNLSTLSNSHLSSLFNDPLSLMPTQEIQLKGKGERISRDALMKLRRFWDWFVQIYNDKQSSPNSKISVKELSFLPSSMKEIGRNQNTNITNQKRTQRSKSDSGKYIERNDVGTAKSNRAAVLGSYKHNVLEYLD